MRQTSELVAPGSAFVCASVFRDRLRVVYGHAELSSSV